MSPRTRTSSKPTTIDDYLATLDGHQRTALERLRKNIQRAVPKAEECISYQLPAFRLDGRALVWFGATSRHCAYYPGAVVDLFREELASYEISKGTVRFQPETPLPAALVRKLVRARIERIASRKTRTAKGTRGGASTPRKKS